MAQLWNKIVTNKFYKNQSNYSVIFKKHKKTFIPIFGKTNGKIQTL